MPYLLLALVVSVIGVVVVMFRNRRPSGTNVSIDDFERRRDALRPSGSRRSAGSGGRRTGWRRG